MRGKREEREERECVGLRERELGGKRFKKKEKEMAVGISRWFKAVEEEGCRKRKRRIERN